MCVHVCAHTYMRRIYYILYRQNFALINAFIKLNLSLTLGVFLSQFKADLAAVYCTFSILSVSFFLNGSHTSSSGHDCTALCAVHKGEGDANPITGSPKPF